MAQDTVEKTIDGEIYTFHQMDPMTSVMVLTKILKMTGTSIGMTTEQIGNVDNFMDAEVEDVVTKIDIGKIVAALCDRLNEDDIKQIIYTMISQVHHRGAGELSKCFNVHFKGRISHLFKVVYAAMEVEYADFFGEGSVLQGFLKRTSINLTE